jgi:hypothetical protein
MTLLALATLAFSLQSAELSPVLVAPQAWTLGALAAGLQTSLRLDPLQFPNLGSLAAPRLTPDVSLPSLTPAVSLAGPSLSVEMPNLSFVQPFEPGTPSGIGAEQGDEGNHVALDALRSFMVRMQDAGRTETTPTADLLDDFFEQTGFRPPVPPPPEHPLPPGKDLAPKFSDPVRMGLILKIISAVYNGSPLPYPWKDGAVYANHDGSLPEKPLGYYREYTVLPPDGTTMTVTVGDRTFQISPPQGHRGAERLIIGGGEVAYYTPDHYGTFIKLEILR